MELIARSGFGSDLCAGDVPFISSYIYRMKAMHIPSPRLRLFSITIIRKFLFSWMIVHKCDLMMILKKFKTKIKIEKNKTSKNINQSKPVEFTDQLINLSFQL